MGLRLRGWCGVFWGMPMMVLRVRLSGRLSALAVVTRQGWCKPKPTPRRCLENGRFLVRDPWAGGSTYEVGTEWIGHARELTSPQSSSPAACPRSNAGEGLLWNRH